MVLKSNIPIWLILSIVNMDDNNEIGILSLVLKYYPDVMIVVMHHDYHQHAAKTLTVLILLVFAVAFVALR
jgi:hypothetical protein